VADAVAKSKAQPELVFGLVGPLGTDLELVATHLKNALAQVRYRAEVFRLSHFMREIKAEPWSKLQNGPEDVVIKTHIDAGDALRRKLGRNDAMAMLGIGALREHRQNETGEATKPITAFAAILRSLKRPEEIEALRKIYGAAFVVLAAYSPRARRVQDLARRIAESRYSHQAGEFMSTAEQLVAIDEAEAGNDFGQDVRDAFASADVIVNAADPQSLPESIRRFVEILFGNTLQTPTRDEQGMYLAQAAAFRSASLARQVGAVICRDDGSVVAVGSNEVPRPGGGQYWAGDDPDGRDFRLGHDSSDRMRESLLGDILDRLKKSGWLRDEKASVPTKELVRDLIVSVPEGAERPVMKGAQFTATIDYVRAVHAEMAAITDAARHGARTSDAELYTTTFPCHDCAKHIVAAGIKRVVYVEPYPKSLVSDLYGDSVLVDSDSECGAKVRIQPFVGIAPKRYAEWFALMKRTRKSKDGSVVVWRSNEAVPQLPESTVSAPAWLSAEAEEFKRFESELVSALTQEKKQ
jgi:cytidine deaminase